MLDTVLGSVTNRAQSVLTFVLMELTIQWEKKFTKKYIITGLCLSTTKERETVP